MKNSEWTAVWSIAVRWMQIVGPVVVFAVVQFAQEMGWILDPEAKDYSKNVHFLMLSFLSALFVQAMVLIWQMDQVKSGEHLHQILELDRSIHKYSPLGDTVRALVDRYKILAESDQVNSKGHLTEALLEHVKSVLPSEGHVGEPKTQIADGGVRRKIAINAIQCANKYVLAISSGIDDRWQYDRDNKFLTSKPAKDYFDATTDAAERLGKEPKPENLNARVVRIYVIDSPEELETVRKKYVPGLADKGVSVLLVPSSTLKELEPPFNIRNLLISDSLLATWQNNSQDFDDIDGQITTDAEEIKRLFDEFKRLEKVAVPCEQVDEGFRGTLSPKQPLNPNDSKTWFKKSSNRPDQNDDAPKG